MIKVNSVFRVAPQISIYDVHRVHFGRFGDRQIPRQCSKLTRFLESYLIYRYRSLSSSPSIRTILFRAARFDRAMPIAGTADNPPKTRARLIVYFMLSAVPVCTQRRMRVRSAVASKRIWSGWNAAASRADWRSVGDSERAGIGNKGYYWSYLLGTSVRKNLPKSGQSYE